MRALAALAVGCAVVLGGCGGDAEVATPTQIQPTETAAVVAPTATSVAPTATSIPPTPTFASAAAEWLPTVLPDTQTPTTVLPTATPAPTATPPAPSIAMRDTTRLDAPRFEHTAALLPDGRVILGGGLTGSVSVSHDLIAVGRIPVTYFDIFHPGQGWSVISLANDDMAIPLPSMVLMADGTIMVVRIGGDQTGEDFTAAATLDPETQLWTPLPAPSITTRNLEALRRIKGKIDTSLPAPSLIPALGTEGGPHLAPLRDGRVIAVSNQQLIEYDGTYYVFTPKSEIFDPRARQWQKAASPNNIHISQDSTIVALQNDEILLIHPGHPSDSPDDEILAEIYDPNADEWRVAPGMRAYSRPKAVVLPDGRVLVVGDAIIEGDDRAWGETASAEIYDPVTGVWTTTGDMVRSRLDFYALTLLSDGRALVSGGMPLKGDILSTTEIYDPGTNIWTPGPDMAVPRYHHTATALPYGRVLIAGGNTVGVGAPPTDTSEIITLP